MDEKQEILEYLQTLNFNTLKAVTELSAEFTEEQLLKIVNLFKTKPETKQFIINFLNTEI